MKTVGIIGFGSFGQFLAEKLDLFAEVRVHSRRDIGSKWAASLKEVAQADYVIPAIPLENYKEVLTSLKPLLGKESILIDVCSVKEEPIAVIKDIMPEQRLVVTHPLFGPESAAESLEGHVMVLCTQDSDEAAAVEVSQFARILGLVVTEMSAEEHDREMAVVQGLTFFVAHVLKECGLHSQKLATPSFKKLLALAELERNHSLELFYTIQKGNPYTDDARDNFIKQAEKLRSDIANHPVV